MFLNWFSKLLKIKVLNKDILIKKIQLPNQ